ncbi:MAG: hypothetical protein U0804_13500 [Gemmataceae bacterium]
MDDFAEITEERIRRGVFRNGSAPEKAIAGYPAGHNIDLKPFTWVADADPILDRITEVRERTTDSGH